MNDAVPLGGGWPTLMSAETASRYLSISEGLLNGLSGRYSVPTIELDGEGVRWRKKDLDRHVAKLPFAECSPNSISLSHRVRLDADQIETLASAVASKLSTGRASTAAKLVSVNEACSMLGLGRSSMYRLIGEGRLKTKRIGRRTLVEIDSIEDLISTA